MKNLIYSYFKPTPKIYRKIGDSLLLAGTCALPYVAQGSKLCAFFVGCTIIGKIITNFFSNDKGGKYNGCSNINNE